MKTSTIKLSDLNKFAANEIAAGRLQEDPEIRIYTGWEGHEHLEAKASVESDEHGTYILLSQVTS